VCNPLFFEEQKENSEKPQFLVSSDTFAKTAGALAQIEVVK